MKEKKTKSSLVDLRAAWRRQVEEAPELNELWLKVAMNNISANRTESQRLLSEFFYGFALSVVASLLIFVSSNAFSSSSAEEDSSMIYLINSQELAYFMR
ncbi:MAG: hypothetical protein IT292_08605 [Deltaproteobacteria bacterium]|nr:hypothetical protein [Deltaproteobacteria bacterium]